MLKLAMLCLVALGVVVAPASSVTSPPIKFTASPLGGGQVQLYWQNFVPGSADTPLMTVFVDGSVYAAVPNPLPLVGENENTATITALLGSHVFRVCEDIQRLASGLNDETPGLCSNTVTRTVT